MSRIRLRSGHAERRRHRQDGLALIEIDVLEEFGKEDDDCDTAWYHLTKWISETAGKPSSDDGYTATWKTASTKILMYCDESLGASYDPTH